MDLVAATCPTASHGPRIPSQRERPGGDELEANLGQAFGHERHETSTPTRIPCSNPAEKTSPAGAGFEAVANYWGITPAGNMLLDAGASYLF